MLKNPLCKGSALITLKLENVLRSQILKADQSQLVKVQVDVILRGYVEQQGDEL